MNANRIKTGLILFVAAFMCFFWMSFGDAAEASEGQTRPHNSPRLRLHNCHKSFHKHHRKHTVRSGFSKPAKLRLGSTVKSGNTVQSDVSHAPNIVFRSRSQAAAKTLPPSLPASVPSISNVDEATWGPVPPGGHVPYYGLDPVGGRDITGLRTYRDPQTGILWRTNGDGVWQCSPCGSPSTTKPSLPATPGTNLQGMINKNNQTPLPTQPSGYQVAGPPGTGVPGSGRPPIKTGTYTNGDGPDRTERVVTRNPDGTYTVITYRFVPGQTDPISSNEDNPDVVPPDKVAGLLSGFSPPSPTAQETPPDTKTQDGGSSNSASDDTIHNKPGWVKTGMGWVYRNPPDGTHYPTGESPDFNSDGTPKQRFKDPTTGFVVISDSDDPKPQTPPGPTGPDKFKNWVNNTAPVKLLKNRGNDVKKVVKDVTGVTHAENIGDKQDWINWKYTYWLKQDRNKFGRTHKDEEWYSDELTPPMPQKAPSPNGGLQWPDPPLDYPPDVQ